VQGSLPQVQRNTLVLQQEASTARMHDTPCRKSLACLYT
jgi:hypothetical protein